MGEPAIPIIPPTYANTRENADWIFVRDGVPVEGIFLLAYNNSNPCEYVYRRARTWNDSCGNYISFDNRDKWRYTPGQTYWFPPTDIPPEDDLILAEYETGGGLQFWVGYFQPDGSLDDNGAIVLDQDKDDFVAWQFVTRWQPIEGV